MRLLVVHCLMWFAASLPAQGDQEPAQLVAQLGGEQRAAARQRLLQLGGRAVPALIAVLRETDATVLREVLAILGEIGAAAAPALPALLAVLADGRRSEPLCLPEILTTLADLAPFRGDVAIDIDDVSMKVSRASVRVLRAGGVAPEVWVASGRLRVRMEVPRGLDLQEVIAATRACNAYRVEVAVELLGARGEKAQAALPALQALLAGRDPKVLTTDLTVPIRAKAARAILAIAAQGEAVEQARAVLAGGGPAPKAEAEVPERVRTRVRELIGDLDVEARREAAVANLTALGELAAVALAEALQQDHDAGFRDAALLALREMGPRAAGAVPVLLDVIAVLPTDHTVAVMQTLIAAAPWCRDAVPGLATSSSTMWIEVRGRRLSGDVSNEFLDRFSEAQGLLYAALSVDPGCTLAELQALLRSKSVLIREAALDVVRRRGAAARKLLPMVAAMLDDPQPVYHTTRRIGQGVTSEQRDRTGTVRLLAARAIIAVAERHDPLMVRARELLAPVEPASGK